MKPITVLALLALASCSRAPDAPAAAPEAAADTVTSAQMVDEALADVLRRRLESEGGKVVVARASGGVACALVDFHGDLQHRSAYRLTQAGQLTARPALGVSELSAADCS